MKRFLWFMTVVFLILTIVCYSNSVRSVSGLSYDVVNIQMTIFASACAILCVINFVGALIISAIENASIDEIKQTETNTTQNDLEKDNNEASSINNIPQNENEIIAKPNEVVFCDLCGTRKTKLTRVIIQTRKGPQEKKICDKCLSEKTDVIL